MYFGVCVNTSVSFIWIIFFFSFSSSSASYSRYSFWLICSPFLQFNYRFKILLFDCFHSILLSLIHFRSPFDAIDSSRSSITSINLLFIIIQEISVMLSTKQYIFFLIIVSSNSLESSSFYRVNYWVSLNKPFTISEKLRHYSIVFITREAKIFYSRQHFDRRLFSGSHSKCCA